jgi:large subunit ribosomal protein L22
MGRAFRYQRRLTHILLSVAERETAASLVTTADEPPTATKTARAAQGATKKKASKKA